MNALLATLRSGEAAGPSKALRRNARAPAVSSGNAKGGGSGKQAKRAQDQAWRAEVEERPCGVASRERRKGEIR